MYRRGKPSQQTDIAKERIAILFKQAKKNPKYANRYIFIARKIAMKFNVKMTPAQRRQFCHKCYHYLQPGRNVKVRTNPKTKAVEYTCQDRKHINRYGYSKK